MTPEHIEHFRTLLQTHRQELQANIDTAEESTRPVTLDQATFGRLSRMDAMQSQTMAVETARRWEMQLQRIDSALARVKNGTYGLCFECDEEIAFKRLEADPAATLCIECASMQENS
ncbi:TraR/DksA family transcriptional regulator [Desulfoplanes sp.]